MKTKPSNSTPRSSASPPIPYQDEAKFARAICLFRDFLGEFSYKCEGPTNQLLVCSENGCPIAIHEVCMITEPAFDDTGKFYCPYCWYKRELERTEELRREALLAERDLLNYKYNLLKWDGGNEKKHEDGADNMKAANPSTMEGKNDSGDFENGLDHDQTICVESVCEEKYDYGSISTAHGPDNVACGQLMQEDDIEDTSGSENDGNDDDGPRCMKPCNPNHFEIVNDTLCLSTKGTSNIAVVLAPITKDATSNVPAIESFKFVSPDLDTMTLRKRKKCIKHTAQRAWPRRVVSPKNHSFQPSTSPKERKIYQQGEATTATNSVHCQELTKRICSMNPTLGYGKRRRLNWTTEEEDMLKEGVRRFSLTINKNIPWRKILEFGHNVFDNRLSADLKDKWKKIMAKEDPKCDKGTLVRFEE